MGCLYAYLTSVSACRYVCALERRFGGNNNCKLFLESIGGSEKSLLFCELKSCLRTFTTDAASQLDVLRHDGDTLGVDGAQVGVLEEANQVCFGRLLESHDGGALEA